MPRPYKARFVGAPPRVTAFKPSGVPGHKLQIVTLGLDELEALRLADVKGLYQDAAAERMGISRATFGRLIQTAHHKVATALLNGRMLVFEGGPIAAAELRAFTCGQCMTDFHVPCGTGRPVECPSCGSPRVHRAAESRGRGRRRRGCGGRRATMNDAARAAGPRRQRGMAAGSPEPLAADEGE